MRLIICGSDHAESRGPTRLQITYALVEISFQNTKQFSKHKISFQNEKISFQNKSAKNISKHKSPLKTQITAQIHKINFLIVNTANYKSVKLRFLSVMSSLFSAPLKFNICRPVLKRVSLNAEIRAP